MGRMFAAVLLCLVAACHHDTKDTTPKGGAGSGSGSASQSMNDNGPSGSQLPGTPGGGGGGGAGNGSSGPVAGGDAGSGSGVGNTTGPTAPPEGPPIVPPNLDPDPTQAKSAVDQHLQVARQALSAPTPQPDTALAEARAALAIDATSVDAAAMVAFAYYHKKLYDTAELILDDVFKRPVAKQNANIYYVYGLIYDHTNRPQQAELAFNKAVELNANFPSALENVGQHQLQNQQYAAAVSTFESLTGKFQRNDAVALTSLGSAYRGHAADYPPGSSDRETNLKQADQAYNRAEQANPSYGPAFYNRGLLYLDNDPFPGISDPLVRLQTAKDLFDKYKATPGADTKLVADRAKDVDKAIKKAQKKAKAKTPPSDAKK